MDEDVMTRIYASLMEDVEKLKEQTAFLEQIEKLTHSEVTPEVWAMIVESLPSIKNAIEMLTVSLQASGSLEVTEAQMQSIAEDIMNSGVEMPKFMTDPE